MTIAHRFLKEFHYWTALSEDGTRLFVVDLAYGTATQYDIYTGNKLREIKLHPDKFNPPEYKDWQNIRNVLTKNAKLFIFKGDQRGWITHPGVEKIFQIDFTTGAVHLTFYRKYYSSSPVHMIGLDWTRARWYSFQEYKANGNIDDLADIYEFNLDKPFANPRFIQSIRNMAVLKIKESKELSSWAMAGFYCPHFSVLRSLILLQEKA